MITKIDFLTYDNHLITNCYFETLVRYSFYFSNSEEFFGFAISKFFSQQAIKSRLQSINSHAAYQFVRLCELMQFKPALVKHVDDIVAKSIEVIEASELNHEEGLGHEETNYIYSVLGLFACNVSYIDEQNRF